MKSKDRNEPLKPLADEMKADIPLASEDAENLINFLNEVPDPRHPRGVRYKYSDLLLMCIYVVLAGYSKPFQVQTYIRVNYDYFHAKIGLENGVFVHKCG